MQKLLELDKVIEPYERTLNNMPAKESRAWARTVKHQLEKIADLDNESMNLCFQCNTALVQPNTPQTPLYYFWVVCGRCKDYVKNIWNLNFLYFPPFLTDLGLLIALSTLFFARSDVVIINGFLPLIGAEWFKLNPLIIKKPYPPFCVSYTRKTFNSLQKSFISLLQKKARFLTSKSIKFFASQTSNL